MSEPRAGTRAADFTADEVESAIEHAMRDRNFEAVVSLLKLLAVKDPDRADLVLRTIKVGLTVAVERAAAEVDGASADLIEEARRSVRDI